MSELNLDYLHARPVMTRSWRHLKIVLVGCGGTGSWLAPSIIRLAYAMGDVGKSVSVTLIDGDVVEQKNIPRQNFCAAEIGQNKARALALRYSMAWGMGINVVSMPLDIAHIGAPRFEEMTVVVGCVDNAAARKTIADALTLANKDNVRSNSLAQMWWLDCGNAHESGQVLLGTAPRVEELRDAFNPESICRALPLPSWQRPELLQALPEELTESKLSCADEAIRNAQSLMVNQAMAALAADYLLRLLLTNDLKRFASYIDLGAGVTKSLYTTPQAVAQAVGIEESVFAIPEKGAKQS